MGERLQPIRDIDQVHDITVTLSKLKSEHGRRMFLLWMVGIHMGLRISDIVDLKVGDLARKITIPVPKPLRDAVRARCADRGDGDWLLKSRKRTRGGNENHITRQAARLDMREIGRICRVEQRIGCHTMRKTFGYHYYQRTHDIAILQEWFYHSSPATTLIYIGVTLENFEKMVDKSPFDDMHGVEL